MQPKYEIGQTCWMAKWDSAENYVTCPDCGGDGRLRVIMGDDTEVSVECRACQVGYDSPSGKIRVYDRRGRTEPVTIDGMTIETGKVEYHVRGSGCSWRVPETELFLEREDAQRRADEIAASADADERKRIQEKEKDTRSWAWNANYHRAQIRECKRRIAYHESKLAVASLRAKEPVAEAT